ncbi:MAG TPA: PIN domain-containing protein [Thermomicrobiales bacterium]|jgi:predicted nucleic acid-binding protein
MTRPVEAASRYVLVDSSAWFALTERRDAEHRRASVVAARLANDHRTLLTTNYVVAEAHALLLNRAGRHLAWVFLQEVVAGGDVALVRVGEDDEQRALEILESYHDKDFSLTDAASFAIMERLGIVEAFTFDRHFLQFGFAVLGLAP